MVCSEALYTFPSILAFREIYLFYLAAELSEVYLYCAKWKVLLKCQARGQYDEIRLKYQTLKINFIIYLPILSLPPQRSRRHLDSVLCECFDVSGFNGSFSLSDGFEEISSRSQTKPLLPHTVGRGEVFLKLLSECRVIKIEINFSFIDKVGIVSLSSRKLR